MEYLKKIAIESVCYVLEITEDQLMLPRRFQDNVSPRRYVMALLLDTKVFSLKSIAKAVCLKHHTTVLHHQKKHNNYLLYSGYSLVWHKIETEFMFRKSNYEKGNLKESGVLREDIEMQIKCLVEKTENLMSILKKAE